MNAHRHRHAASLLPALSRVGLLVALIITLHQIAMASPMHGEIMPMTVGDGHLGAPMHDACPTPCPIQLPAICPVVQAAWPAALIAALVLLILAFLIAALPALVRTERVGFIDWRPPPKRQRALLQVFRC